MNKEQIESRIQRIKDLSDDGERAHVEEDALREDFIKHIATMPQLKELAELVLSTNQINFCRWYA